MNTKPPIIDPVLGNIHELDFQRMLMLHDAVLKYKPSSSIQKRYEFYKLGFKGFKGQIPSNKKKTDIFKQEDTLFF